MVDDVAETLVTSVVGSTKGHGVESVHGTNGGHGTNVGQGANGGLGTNGRQVTDRFACESNEFKKSKLLKISMSCGCDPEASCG